MNLNTSDSLALPLKKCQFIWLLSPQIQLTKTSLTYTPYFICQLKLKVIGQITQLNVTHVRGSDTQAYIASKHQDVSNVRDLIRLKTVRKSCKGEHTANFKKCPALLKTKSDKRPNRSSSTQPSTVPSTSNSAHNNYPDQVVATSQNQTYANSLKKKFNVSRFVKAVRATQ